MYFFMSRILGPKANRVQLLWIRWSQGDNRITQKWKLILNLISYFSYFWIKINSGQGRLYQYVLRFHQCNILKPYDHFQTGNRFLGYDHFVRQRTQNNKIIESSRKRLKEICCVPQSIITSETRMYKILYNFKTLAA